MFAAWENSLANDPRSQIAAREAAIAKRGGEESRARMREVERRQSLQPRMSGMNGLGGLVATNGGWGAPMSGGAIMGGGVTGSGLAKRMSGRGVPRSREEAHREVLKRMQAQAATRAVGDA